MFGQNQLTLNGTDTRDFGNTSRDGKLFYSVPAFAEVEVSTAAHDIESQSPGVIVNMVTKSGSNRLHGAARFYYSDETLAGDNVSDELIEQGVETGNPNTLLADLDLQVGGALVRDKLWGFVDYWRFDEQRLILGIPDDERDERSLRNVTVNLDWQVAADHRLALRYFYSGRFVLNSGAGPSRPPAVSWLGDPFDNHLVQVNWLGAWGDNTYSDLRASYSTRGRDPDSPAPHPDYPLGVPFGYDFMTGTISGEPGLYRGWQRDVQLRGNVAHHVPGAHPRSEGRRPVHRDERIGALRPPLWRRPILFWRRGRLGGPLHEPCRHLRQPRP